MRSYPRNSPRAAARILALAMLSDGHLSQAELETLEHTGAREQLGINPLEWHDVMHDFCQDLLAGADQNWSSTCQLEPQIVASLLEEIDDPLLRQKLLALCVDLIDADDHIADGERLILRTLLEQWNPAHSELAPV